MSNQIPETRERILKASLKLLESAKGKVVRVSDVAAEAGVTRQTLYLYFGSRAELLIATTRYLDTIKNSDARLAPSRAAESGIERLDAFITAWANYIPDIYGVAQALTVMNDADATAVWDKRMQDMWEGCNAAVKALQSDGHLVDEHTVKEASDLLWMLLSVNNWKDLRINRRWSQPKYVRAMITSAHGLIVVTDSQRQIVN